MPNRPTGMRSISSREPAIIGVSMSDGARALAVMPSRANSFAIDFVIAMIPALEAA